jgi:hypothetical protein
MPVAKEGIDPVIVTRVDAGPGAVGVTAAPIRLISQPRRVQAPGVVTTILVIRSVVGCSLPGPAEESQPQSPLSRQPTPYSQNCE